MRTETSGLLKTEEEYAADVGTFVAQSADPPEGLCEVYAGSLERQFGIASRGAKCGEAVGLIDCGDDIVGLDDDILLGIADDRVQRH